MVRAPERRRARPPARLRRRLAAGLLAALWGGSGALASARQAQPAPPLEPAQQAQRVPLAELAAAMAAEQGYDARKITNLPRFQAGVLLRLAAQARARRPDGPPLFIDHVQWFEAYLERVGLAAAQAPISSRLSFEHRQDTWIEYRPERVVRQVVEGPPLSQALNVYIGPQAGAAVPPRYSYDDLDSDPQLRVTVERSFRYHLLDLGQWVLFDEIEGLYGRPTTGLLGALFTLIGEARAVYSRIAIAEDQVQVVVGRGQKGFLSRTATVVIRPDGTATRDVPRGRPDLAALEERLRQQLEIEYAPWPDWMRAARPEAPREAAAAPRRQARRSASRADGAAGQREAVAVRLASLASARATCSRSIFPSFQ